jgi:ABC-2 type transport system ATP-binding protein
MPPPVTLALDTVRVRYGRRTAVAGLTLRVRGGEVVGLLGPNGSGKSTTLAVCAGVLDPVEGTVTVDGVSPGRDRSGYARRVGFVPQDVALYDELTVADNLTFFGHLYGVHGRVLENRIAAGLDLVGLADRARHRVGTLSGGMQRRVNVACALVHEPAVLLLDEPTAALDPASREDLYQTLAQLRDAGRAILLTTHHLDEAEHWCDRVGVLAGGRLVAEGRPADLARHRGAVVVGKLRDELPELTERAIRARLPADVDFDVAGRAFRLAAADGESLAYALAAVHGEGAQAESFRTPAADQARLFVPAAVPAAVGGT